jgi:hypothetical protein
LLHLRRKLRGARLVPGTLTFPRFHPGTRFLRNYQNPQALFRQQLMEEMHMKKTLAILATVATVGATSLTAPAEARGIWRPAR